MWYPPGEPAPAPDTNDPNLLPNENLTFRRPPPDTFDLTVDNIYNYLSEGNGGFNGSVPFNLNNSATSRDLFHLTVTWMHLYLTPIIILVGIVGNTMSFLVFTFTHLQRLSSSLYLSALALADIGYLLGLFIVWLELVDIHIHTRVGWCQGVNYATRVCGFLAVWSVVSFTAERYISVYHPLRKDSFCTKKKARIVVLCLVLFSLVFYSFVIWTFGIAHFGPSVACFPLPKYYDIYTIMTSLDVICACVVPSLLIVVLNVRIILKIHHYQTRRAEVSNALVLPTAADNMRRRSLIHTSVSTTGSMHIKFSTKHQERQTRFTLQELQELTATPGHSRCQKLVRGQTQFRTARMLLVLSSIFVCLNLPSHVFRVQVSLERIKGGSAKVPRWRFKWQELFEFVYFLTFAINFFIYSACGRQFRVGLTRLCRRWRYKLQKCGKVLRIGRHIRDNRRERLERLSIDGYNVKIRIPKPPGT